MSKFYSEEEILKRSKCAECYEQVKSILDNTPVADVTEVKHGEWVEDKSNSSQSKKVYYCSLCNHWQATKNQRQLNQIMYMNYCPYCGARMDKPQKQYETFGFDEKVVRMATSIAIKKVQRPNPKYISAILKKWHDLGLKTHSDVKEYEEEKNTPKR